jgi:methionyl-tRNA formyltransferase
VNTYNKKSRVFVLHSKPWCEEIFDFSCLVLSPENYDLIHIRHKKELEAIKDFQSSDNLLFIHWNWLVPREITDKYKCICFHMTDLPYGRGGSPLQNLLMRDASSTKISAIKMTQVLDAGPVYLKRDLALRGSALDIYLRAGQLSLIMAKDIISGDIQPTPQVGKVVEFERLAPANNLIQENNLSLEHFKNMVRMVDAPGYPNAYILYGNLKIIFRNVNQKDDKLFGKFTVERKKNAD